MISRTDISGLIKQKVTGIQRFQDLHRERLLKLRAVCDNYIIFQVVLWLLPLLC